MKIKIIIVVLILIASFCNYGCGKKFEADRFAQKYVELHRSHNVDGLLALHTNDAEFIIPGQRPVRGKNALKDLFEWDAVLGSQLTMSDISMNGDTILINSITERNKFFLFLGIPEVRYQPGTRFVLRNGLIAGTYPSALTEESLKKGVEKYERLIQWLSANRPDTLERLMPGGKLTYNGANAKMWLEMFDEWKRLSE